MPIIISMRMDILLINKNTIKILPDLQKGHEVRIIFSRNFEKLRGDKLTGRDG